MNALQTAQPIEIYQGQFGEFTITPADRRSVIFYRASLMVAALCFAIATGLVLWEPQTALKFLTPLYTGFVLSLGVSLLLIHIYMAVLHRALQVFWAIGAIASLVVAHTDPAPFALTVYQQPMTLLGIGFLFVALTGIFFKEAFCFDRAETKLLVPIVPVLLLGHLAGALPIALEKSLLVFWAALFLVFALRKLIQAIPDDIGDKSVFTYLKHQQTVKT